MKSCVIFLSISVKKQENQDRNKDERKSMILLSTVDRRRLPRVHVLLSGGRLQAGDNVALGFMSSQIMAVMRGIMQFKWCVLLQSLK